MAGPGAVPALGGVGGPGGRVAAAAIAWAIPPGFFWGTPSLGASWISSTAFWLSSSTCTSRPCARKSHRYARRQPAHTPRIASWASAGLCFMICWIRSSGSMSPIMQ